METRLAQAHDVIYAVDRRLGADPGVRRLLQRAQAWCVLVGFYLAVLDESWGPAVPNGELTRVGSHAAERYLSSVGEALCGVLRSPGETQDVQRAATVHRVRDALVAILDALLHPAVGEPAVVRAFG